MSKTLSVRLFLLITLLVLMAGVFPAAAQDDVTPAPTVVVTPTPDEAPVVEPPVIIDQSQIPTWAVVIILVLVLGVVSVAYAGIINSAKQAPEWTREILLSIAGSGLDSVGKYVKITPTPLDDMAYDELRKLYDQLRADLLVTNQQVEALKNADASAPPA